MSADLATALNDVTFALSPLPDGYYIEGDKVTGGILVCCKYPEPEGLGFFISKKVIDEGRHVQAAEGAFPGLMKAVEAQTVPEPKGVANGPDPGHVE